MAQDKYGYVYMGSALGLSRFDGKSFYNKAIPEIYNNSAHVNFVETTQDGNIVVSTIGQGLFVQQNDGKFKQYLPDKLETNRKKHLSSLKICPDNSILVCGSNNLYHLKNDSLMNIYNDVFNSMFATVEIDKDNNIWFGGSKGLGVLKHTGTKYEPFYIPYFTEWGVTKILFDNEGTLHVGTTYGYFRMKWEQPWQWNENYSIEEPFSELYDYKINALHLDKEENLWISTTTYGFFKTKGDTILLHLTKENGLLSSTALCMLQDAEGNYWFATNNGVSMIDNFDNYALEFEGKLFNEAFNFVLDRFNRIWINVFNGIFVYQDEKLIPINLKGTPIQRAGIRQIVIYDSQLWISSSDGIFRIPVTKTMPDMKKLREVPALFATYYELPTDSTELFGLTANKICKYDNNKFHHVIFNHEDSVRLNPSMIIRDKYGYYWYSDVDNGLYRGTISQPQKNKYIFDIDKVYKSLNADSTFVTMWLKFMCSDKKGNLWIASHNTGVYKLTLDKNGVASYKLYSTANGLSSNQIKGLEFDSEGRLWIANLQGYNILKFDENGNESIESIGKREGILGVGLGFLIKDDKIFLNTTEGLCVYKNQFFNKKQKEIPKIFITNFFANGLPVESLYGSNKIRLTHGQNNISIEFSAISFRNADKIMYQHKLEGVNKDWGTLSEHSFVEYASLRPGKYTFKVRAAIEDVFGEETTLTFRIAPAFYQTFWFYLLIAGVIFALFYAFHKYRVRHAVNMERMRTRIASDLHDDIGSTLSSISMLTEMAKNQDKEEMLANALSKIGENSRDVLNAIDDIIWSVNPQNDSLSNLIIRLREYAIPVCEAKNITLSMNVDAAVNMMKLGMDERRNTYLIVKEAINNAVKHSGCKNLTIDFVNNHHLEVLIKDDGCGFDPAEPTSRNGLINMMHRAKHFGAELSIKSEHNAGTSILLKAKNHIVI